ncbi:MAG: N-acetylmuramoyl-L-alanine amidase [Alphaproteobacteria bacterium]|nr:MAG: N-acetylmuramoyl-L-alanine amidase [Alphaproteobacteria bacterium]
MYSVGVDDGHGYNTPGKRTPNNYPENEFNHYTKEFLIKALTRCGIKPIDCSPTREDNSLSDRCKIANYASCDLFVSIHYNALGNTWRDDIGGIETYYWSGPNNEAGKKFATLIHNNLIQGTPLINRGVKSADFYVLRETNMIAALCECGFMDNPKEAALMDSVDYRRECSEEICKGICQYLGVNYVAELPPQPVKSDRDVAIERMRQVSKWADKYIVHFDQLQKNNLNVYGLINKLWNHK